MQIGNRNLPICELCLPTFDRRHERETKERISGEWNFMPVYFCTGMRISAEVPSSVLSRLTLNP